MAQMPNGEEVMSAVKKSSSGPGAAKNKRKQFGIRPKLVRKLAERPKALQNPSSKKLVRTIFGPTWTGHKHGGFDFQDFWFSASCSKSKGEEVLRGVEVRSGDWAGFF